MFKTEEKSTFKYWFAHWCAFQTTALNLHIWKFKYLFHDIEKPWMMSLLYGNHPEEYPKVRSWHRKHNKHHIEWLDNHFADRFDIDAFIIDNECSRITKEDSPVTAREWITTKYKEARKEWWQQTDTHFDYNLYKKLFVYHKAIARINELGI